MLKKLIQFIIIPVLSFQVVTAFTPLGKPLAMGQAYTSISQDADAINFNPAGIGNINNLYCSVSGSSLYPTDEPITIININLAYPIFVKAKNTLSVLGLSVNTLSADSLFQQLEYTLALTFNFGKFNNFRQMGFKDLIVGVSSSFIRKKYLLDINAYSPLLSDNNSKDTVNFNLGILARLKSKLSVGLSIKDILTKEDTFTSNDETYKDMSITIGASYPLRISGYQIKPSFDIGLNASALIYNFGTETSLFKRYFMMLGYNGGQEISDKIAFGLGYKFKSRRKTYEINSSFNFVPDTYEVNLLQNINFNIKIYL